MKVVMHPIIFGVLLTLLFSGCASGSGSLFNDPACSYRGSDGIDACIRTVQVSPSASRPKESAGQLYVNNVLVYGVQVLSGYYYDAQDAQWDTKGEWVIYNIVLHQDTRTVTTVSGFNFLTREKWSAPLDTSGGRTVASGRVFFNHLEAGTTTRWSIRLDGTDLRKES